MPSLSKTPINRAAYLVAPKQKPVEIRDAPYTSPKVDEIVIKNRALAINPIDWVKQDMGAMVFSWAKYPCIEGNDVAGEVVEVGPLVTRFKTGDRVVGLALGLSKERNTPTEGAFQLYTVLVERVVSPIPDGMSFEDASVLPLGLSTAACGLFQPEQLGLQLPTSKPSPTNKTILIWGGSTSVGCNAIQLGVAAGYSVITTSSPKNFALCKSLGASHVFEYRSSTVRADISRVLADRTVAGAISIGTGGADACMAILRHCKGNKFLSMATYPLPDPAPESFVMLRIVWSVVSWSVVNWFRARAWGIKKSYISGQSLAFNKLGHAIYEDWLPKALAEGTFVPAPSPYVVGNGLEYIQPALDFQKKGVSAMKVVVSL